MNMPKSAMRNYDDITRCGLAVVRLMKESMSLSDMCHCADVLETLTTMARDFRAEDAHLRANQADEAARSR